MKIDWKSSFIACTSLFLLFLTTRYWNVLEQYVMLIVEAAWTLLLGAMIAYVVNLLMSWFERRLFPRAQFKPWLAVKRPLCMILSFATIVVAFIFLMQLILPKMLEGFQDIFTALPDAVTRFIEWLDDKVDLTSYMQTLLDKIPSDAAGWEKLLGEKADVLLTGFGGVMDFIIKLTLDAFNSFVTIFMALIFAINILFGKEKLQDQFTRLFRRILGDGLMGKINHAVSVLNSCFHSFIVGQIIEAIILGVLCALGMKLLNLPHEVMIGAMMGLLALIPIAGAYIGAALGTVVILVDDPMKALIFLVFIIVLQQIEGNLIYPHTVGSSLHLPGMWVLAAVTIGGTLMGIAGMLFFVPITAALYRLLGEWSAQEDQPSVVESIVAFDNAPQEEFEAVTQQRAANPKPAGKNHMWRPPVFNKRNKRNKKR